MQFTEEQRKLMTAQNVSVRFFDRRGSTDKKRPDGCVCEVRDNTTNAFFCEGVGQSEPEAAEKAFAAIPTASKPLTPAQLADPRFLKLGTVEAENKALKARLAELESQQPDKGKSKQPVNA